MARSSELLLPPTRPGQIALAAGVAVAGAATAVLATVDPTRTRLLPPCPFRALTGHWCPGCGSTRALHQLLQGDVGAAAGLNPLMVAALPVVLVAAAVWAASRLDLIDAPPVVLPRAVPWAVLVVVMVFWVLRNIPAGPFPALAP